MSQKRTGDEFSGATKVALAKRAQFHCSRPTCRKPTIGPSDEAPDATKSIGAAAHIWGAHSGSARFDPTMTPEQRSAIENGIWLCSDHAKEVDDDEVAYPITLLKEWQARHKEWVNARFGQSAQDKPKDSDHSVTQSIVNSPGALQVAGDLILAADRRIVQSLTFQIKIKQQTSARNPGPVEVDFGLQSIVALFTQDKVRIRFASDFKVADQQVDTETRELTFTYAPETPSDVCGKQVAFLRSIDKLAVNFAEILRIQGFAQSGEPISLDLNVSLNGIPVIAVQGGVDRTGTLAKGQAVVSVIDYFSRIPELYEAAVSSLRPGS